MFKYIFILLLTLLTINLCYGTEKTIPINIDQIGIEQKRWTLPENEYKKYQQLMDDTAAGHWYKELDPIEVLGIMANSEQERYRYAKLAAQQHKQRTERELAFQAAFNKAFAELFPNLTPIATDDKIPFDQLVSNDQLLLFIDKKDLVTEPLHQLFKKLDNAPHIKLHIYVQSKGNDLSIQQWARKNALPQTKLQSGQITLNHDKGRRVQMLGTENQQKTPLIMLLRQGELHHVELF